jgi:cytochrome c553
MRNTILMFFTLITIGLMVYTYSQGGAYHGGEHGKVVGDISNASDKKMEKAEEKNDRAKEQDSLNALREKAGSAAGFKVSQKYKSKCASCHGINGSGFQYGKKLMGAKLIGLKEEKLLKDLTDYKSGKKANVIMKGLLLSLNQSDLEELAKEISEFEGKKNGTIKEKEEKKIDKYDISSWGM